MAAWKVAESLDRLLAQLNAFAPNRSKASDGSIGDAAHAARDSDHNPWLVLDGQQLVTARDFTHDPAGGLDCNRLRDVLVAARDSRIKYLIWDRKITSGARESSPWLPRPYTGTNPHTKHLHLSVVADDRCRDSTPWMLPGLGGVVTPAMGTYCRVGDRSDRVMKLQQFMTSHFPSYNAYRPTGFYGVATSEGLREFQKRVGITGPDADGKVCGPRTLAKLREYGFMP